MTCRVFSSSSNTCPNTYNGMKLIKSFCENKLFLKIYILFVHKLLVFFALFPPPPFNPKNLFSIKLRWISRILSQFLFSDSARCRGPKVSPHVFSRKIGFLEHATRITYLKNGGPLGFTVTVSSAPIIHIPNQPKCNDAQIFLLTNLVAIYVVCPKSKCTDFPMYKLAM